MRRGGPATVLASCGRAAALAVAWATLVLAPPPAGADAGAADLVTAGGGLAWVSSDDLSLLGSLRADLPITPAGRSTLVLSLDTVTAIERATSEFRFDVRELDYSLRLRLAREAGSGAVVSWFLERKGKEMADADGQPNVTAAGLEVASPGFLSYGAPALLAWRASLAVAADRAGVEADALFRGELRLSRRFGRTGLGGDVLLDGIVNGSSARTDLAVGPRFDLHLAGGRRAAFSARYLRERNPLGTGIDGWSIGFDYDEEPPRGASRVSPPDIGGFIAAGAGEGRLAGRFDLVFRSPAFAGGTEAVIEVDANAITADDTGELFYLYHAGVERAAGGGIAGIYAYHRSNHRLAEPGGAVTSFNVIEGGFESPGWGRPPAWGRGWLKGRLDARLRAGILLDSSFGEQDRWHARGGVRLRSALRPSGRATFVSVEAEAGDVERQTWAAGVAASSGAEIRLEYRSDHSYFGRDGNAWLVLLGAGF